MRIGWSRRRSRCSCERLLESTIVRRFVAEQRPVAARQAVAEAVLVAALAARSRSPAASTASRRGIFSRSSMLGKP